MTAGIATSPRFLLREPEAPEAPGGVGGFGGRDELTPPLRLFCFHHAGGAASSFGAWQRALGPAISVLPIQLPGREGRAREPRARDLTELVAELDADLDPWLTDQPYAFYGHSMGALVAHALTRLRFERGRPLPERLVVGACSAPHLRTPLDTAATRSDDELARLLLDIGGMSAAVLGYPQWRQAAVALLRDDLRLCATDPIRGRTPPGTGTDRGPGPDRLVPLPCPIEVFVGATDPLVPVAQAAAWRGYTSASCRVHVPQGGHFFAQDPEAAFPARWLAPLLRVPAGVRPC
ncbi:thioesterase II family protein [Embleya sp. AB8]|uniref:thioesterase II family protein n=1 Tax=Embleya sp. AB8 TaxID=3156304 RepID=UPI003C766360